jgi:hypothetical protein
MNSSQSSQDTIVQNNDIGKRRWNVISSDSSDGKSFSLLTLDQIDDNEITGIENDVQVELKQDGNSYLDLSLTSCRSKCCSATFRNSC